MGLPERNNWTPEPPTEPGWYWTRGDGTFVVNEQPSPSLVRRASHGALVFVAHDGAGVPLARLTGLRWDPIPITPRLS